MVRWINFVITTACLIIAAVWWNAERGYEPLIVMLVGILSLLTIVWDPIKAWKNRRELTKDFPIKLGDPKTKVRKVLGSP